MRMFQAHLIYRNFPLGWFQGSPEVSTSFIISRQLCFWKIPSLEKETVAQIIRVGSQSAEAACPVQIELGLEPSSAEPLQGSVVSLFLIKDARIRDGGLYHPEGLLDLKGLGILKGALLATWLLLKLELRGSQDLPSSLLSATRLKESCPGKCPHQTFPLSSASEVKVLGQILCLSPITATAKPPVASYLHLP